MPPAAGAAAGRGASAGPAARSAAAAAGVAGPAAAAAGPSVATAAGFALSGRRATRGEAAAPPARAPGATAPDASARSASPRRPRVVAGARRPLGSAPTLRRSRFCAPVLSQGTSFCVLRQRLYYTPWQDADARQTATTAQHA